MRWNYLTIPKQFGKWKVISTSNLSVLLIYSAFFLRFNKGHKDSTYIYRSSTSGYRLVHICLICIPFSCVLVLSSRYCLLLYNLPANNDAVNSKPQSYVSIAGYWASPLQRQYRIVWLAIFLSVFFYKGIVKHWQSADIPLSYLQSWSTLTEQNINISIVFLYVFQHIFYICLIRSRMIDSIDRIHEETFALNIFIGCRDYQQIVCLKLYIA